jgi:hypothetical protein
VIASTDAVKATFSIQPSPRSRIRASGDPGHVAAGLWTHLPALAGDREGERITVARRESLPGYAAYSA